MQMQVGQPIVLRNKTRHGFNKLQEHGAFWVVVCLDPRVQCLNNEAGALIRSLSDGDERWIRQSNDRHFDTGVLELTK